MSTKDEQVRQAQHLAAAFDAATNATVRDVLGPALRDALLKAWPLFDPLATPIYYAGWSDGLRDGDPASDPDDEGGDR